MRARRASSRPAFARAAALTGVLTLALAACSSSPPPAPPIVAIATIAPEPPPPPPAEPDPLPPPEPPPAATTEPTATPVAPPPTRPAEAFRVDELRLIAVIFGTKEPRAMFVDPNGLGWVVKIGDLLGRSEELRPGDPASASIYRVAEIRAASIVLARDDPQKPGAPPQRRVVPLAKPKR